jgi:ATP-dependent exoDNAse (exonuclease V) alpha subunit
MDGGAMTQTWLAVHGHRLSHHLARHHPGYPEVSGQWSRQGCWACQCRTHRRAFGEATFEIIDTTPERLTTVKGIGPVRAGRIAAAWVEQRHIREVMAALQGFGLSTSLAVRIYKQFGDQSGMVLTKTPTAWPVRSGVSASDR